MWRFLKKLEIELPYDPAILLLGIHTEETRIEEKVGLLSEGNLSLNSLKSLDF